jgi:plasmid stabilization system protein ParE
VGRPRTHLRYIKKNDPAAASRLVTRLIDRAMDLAQAPNQGREVDEPNARVIVVPRFRYFIFYTVVGEVIHITHISHTSRKRPWDIE